MLPVSPDCSLLIAPLVCLRSVSCGTNVASVSGLSIIDCRFGLSSFSVQDTKDKPKGKSIMDNPEKLATLGPQDTEQRQTKGAINNGQSGDTGNISTTRH
jgi:hypothetical protein